MATPRRLDPSDDSVGGFNDLDNSVVTAATLEHSFVTARLYRLGMPGLVAVLALLIPFAGGSEAARVPVPRGEIFVVGVDGRGPQNLTRTAATESELALSPEGRRIAHLRSERQQFQIWAVNVDGSGQRG